MLSLQPVASMACSWLLVPEVPLKAGQEQEDGREGEDTGTGHSGPPFPKATEPLTATDHCKQRSLREEEQGMTYSHYRQKQ